MTDVFPAAVYLLCLLTSAACALMLALSYKRSRIRLLFWSSLCFAFLAGNNFVLVLDLMVWPDVDLRTERILLSLAAVTSLIWGFVGEREGE